METHHSNFFLRFLILGVFITLSLMGLSSIKPKTYPVAKVTFEKPSVANAKESDILQESEFQSPDGAFSLLVKNQMTNDDMVSQTFIIFSQKDNKLVEIFTKRSKKTEMLEVPFNSFSPNNKFVFLQSREEGKYKYYVLRTDGNPIKKDEKFVEVSSLFYEKYPDFGITEVTGWGAYSDLIVNTDRGDTIGPSWWFELTSFNFVKLSTRFN